MLKPEMLCVCWCSAAALQTSFSLPTAAQITGSPPARVCGLGLLIMSTAWQRGKKKKKHADSFTARLCRAAVAKPVGV